MSLDDVVIIMSIPRRLVLAIRTRRGRSNSPPPLSRSEQKPPVVVIKRDLRDEQDMMDETDHAHRPRSSRDRRTGDGREMSESRSRLGLGLANYSPQSEQLDLYYNSRSNTIEQHTPSWGYKAPAPPSVITEQPKGVHQFQTSNAYYQNAGTLESLAEKVHAFYPGPGRRMSDTRTGVSMSQSQKFPRSGSADILPRVEYSDYSASLGRHSLLRSSLKSGAPVPQIAGGTLGRYGRYDQQSARNAIKYSSPASSTMSRHKPPLDYSSDTEATIGRPNYYYYNQRPNIPLGRGSTAALGGGHDFAKFNSLPRDRNAAAARMNLRSRLVDRIGGEDDGNLSAPEYSLPTARRDRGNTKISQCQLKQI
jgi:Rho GTPase-activating protein SYDE